MLPRCYPHDPRNCIHPPTRCQLVDGYGGRDMSERPHWIRDCPRCGHDVDIGDRNAGTRITCKGCRKRVTLVHTTPPGDGCDTECYEDEHWTLRAPTPRLATL